MLVLCLCGLWCTKKNWRQNRIIQTFAKNKNTYFCDFDRYMKFWSSKKKKPSVWFKNNEIWLSSRYSTYSYWCLWKEDGTILVVQKILNVALKFNAHRMVRLAIFFTLFQQRNASKSGIDWRYFILFKFMFW